MKRRLIFFFMAGVMVAAGARAQGVLHDSVDVLHYHLTLDMGHNADKQLQGIADITFVKTRECGSVTFDLIADSIHPVSLDGVVTRGFNFNRDDGIVQIYVGGMVGDTHVVSIPYFTSGHVESYGFGGMHMDNGIYYNLGAAFREYPHNYGRCFYPCRDNFHDKATYTYVVTSKPGWRSLCSGMLQSSTTNSDGSLTEEWRLSQPIPTYISSVSSAPWNVIETSFAGEHQTYPATLGFINHDSANVVAHFEMLNSVVPMFERCFGPYRWERIGYISTPMGSMEHAQNIALVSTCMSATDYPACDMTTCHELGHAWFGNLVTCSTAGDMWINEGGASFCEEVAAEAINGRAKADAYYQDKLSDVLRATHFSDGGYLSLSNMPLSTTYGSTSYDKGAVVWHSLRGIMGDSLFYSCMHRLFDRCAFGNIDAAGLRDSLSLYSGIDLTGFFDFHVFTPGFVDYSLDCLAVEGNNATLTLRQLLRGTDHYAHGNRVPVTFFSSDFQQSDQWMIFDDSIATQTFSLPFVASFAIVDYHHLLSDACTDGSVTLKRKGRVDVPHAYCRVSVGNPLEEDEWLHVSHHYVRPSSDTVPGIVRLSNRYWEVHARNWLDNVKLQLLYNQGTNGSTGAAYIDDGFYNNPATIDSLCVVYRPNARQPWQVLSRNRLSSSTFSTGYFVAPLFPYGQYALAVIDSNYVGLPSEPSSSEGSQTPRLQLFPNPNHAGFQVDLGGYDKKFNLSIYDMKGNKVLEKRDLSDYCTVQHALPAGTYVVLIKNNFLSLQSQIIVQ